MGNVTSMADYRAERHADDLVEAPEKPHIPLAEVLDADYATSEGRVFAVLSIRNILRYALGAEGDWNQLLWEVLEALQRPDAPGLAEDAIRALRWRMEDSLTEENSSEMGFGLVLLKLVEKRVSSRPLKNGPLG
jgi:hypothetical protein